ARRCSGTRAPTSPWPRCPARPREPRDETARAVVPLFKADKKAPKGPAGRWDVVVGEDMCKACGFCLHVCPTDVFAWRKTPNKLGWFPVVTAHEGNCVGCM